jgi:hypothetical protein
VSKLLYPASPPENLEAVNITVRLIFGSVLSQSSRLTGLDIFDSEGDIILRSSRLRNDEGASETAWSCTSEFFDLDNQPEPNFWPFMELFSQDGFLPGIRVLQSRLSTNEDNQGFGVPFNLILAILTGLRNAISNLLIGINYLGPLRTEPQRFYYVAGQGNPVVAPTQSIARHLLKADQEAIQRINSWLSVSGMATEIRPFPLDERHTLYELRVLENLDSSGQQLSTNLHEVGFGMSQILPVLLQTVLSTSGNTIVVEQPELHLHPRAQAQLGDMFVSIAQRGVRFLIETHSEHLLLRLQKQIARTTAGEISFNERELMLLPSQLAVYFVHRKNGMSTATKVDIGPYGDLLNTPEGFDDFFSDDMIETAERMRARLAGTRQGT